MILMLLFLFLNEESTKIYEFDFVENWMSCKVKIVVASYM